jgi:hypothetical protein
MKKSIKMPIRYLPKNLTKKDKKKQISMLLKSRKMYKKNHILQENKFHHLKAKRQIIL